MSGYAGLANCVHCGFCLQSCPTYVVTGDEADGPRGRIALMQGIERGHLVSHDPTVRHHLDRCLGCRACEPVCPSGVEYGAALETARTAMHAGRAPNATAGMILRIVASPAAARLVFGMARLVRPLARRLAGWDRLGFAAGMLSSSAPWRRRPAGPAITTPPEPTRGAATVFRGCIQDALFGHVNAAARRTLAANGYAVREVAGQGCCGALHAHAGDMDTARALARGNVRAFAADPDAAVAATAAGCGAMLRSYGSLLADEPLAPAARAFADRVRDVTELLADAGPAPGAPLPLTVAYDAPCHLVHAQRVAEPPRAVLAAIPGLRVVEHAERDACCGSAGLYGLVQRDLSQAVLRRKLDALAAVDPAVVVTGNPGCAMQIGAGLLADRRVARMAHPVELLDASYALAGRRGGERVDSADA